MLQWIRFATASGPLSSMRRVEGALYLRRSKSRFRMTVAPRRDLGATAGIVLIVILLGGLAALKWPLPFAVAQTALLCLLVYGHGWHVYTTVNVANGHFTSRLDIRIGRRAIRQERRFLAADVRRVRLDERKGRRGATVRTVMVELTTTRVFVGNSMSPAEFSEFLRTGYRPLLRALRRNGADLS
jgi:hypothetical protein